MEGRVAIVSQISLGVVNLAVPRPMLVAISGP